MHKHRWYQLDRRSLSNLIVICAGICLFLVLTHLQQVKAALGFFVSVLSPFIGGFIIAYLLNTPTNFFERTVFKKLKYRRTLAITTVYFLALIVIAFLLNLLLPQVTSSMTQLMGNLSGYLDNLDAMVQELIQRFQLEGDGLYEVVDIYNKIIRMASTFISSSIPELLNLGVAVGSGVVNAVTAIIFSIYMLAGKDRLNKQLKKLIYALFPSRSVNRILKIGNKANTVFVGFINGKLIDSAIIGVLCFILSMILQIPYAVLLSVVIGVTNVIPFFGPIIGAVPCVMILLIVNPWAALRFIVLIIALQQFDGNILGPKILGDSTGLSAVWVLISIVVGGGLFGFPGMLLGVPTFAVLYSLIRDWVDARLELKGIDAEGRSLTEETEEDTAQP